MCQKNHDLGENVTFGREFARNRILTGDGKVWKLYSQTCFNISTGSLRFIQNAMGNVSSHKTCSPQIAQPLAHPQGANTLSSEFSE